MDREACVYFSNLAKVLPVEINQRTVRILDTLKKDDGVWLCTRRSDQTELRNHVVEEDKNTTNSLWPAPTDEEPSIEQLNEWGYDGVVEATDGCRVEPDGVCEHGYPSWFIHMGVI